MAVSLASEWFDQWKDVPHHPGMDQHLTWCWRHWAPCPLLRANGIQASAMVLQLFAERILVPAGIRPDQAKLANDKMTETGRLCCWLGDDEMYGIWGECAPVSVPGMDPRPR